MSRRIMLLSFCGVLLAASLAWSQSRPGRGKGKVYDAPPARGERHRDKLDQGDAAPDFTLPNLKGDEVTLSSFRGKKPVVLIFGSCT